MSPAPPETMALFEDLRAWRGREARARGVPAYVVFPDETLLELARVRPGDRGELSEVRGVGPRKLAEFGDAVLEMVRGGGSSQKST